MENIITNNEDTILNFVFLSDELEKNGSDERFITGPLFWYILRNNLSYTLNGELKSGYKNILILEGRNSLDSFNFIPTEIVNFVLNNDVKLLATSLADACSLEGYNAAKISLENILPNKFLILNNNTTLTECFTLDYFLEEANYNQQRINNFGLLNELGYISEEIQIPELNSHREKKFLSFNRTTDKTHRAALLHEYLTNDYSDSYFSFINKIQSVGDIPNIGEITSNYEFYNSNLPIELDTQNIDNKHSFNTSSTFKKELFLNSCINIVTEASFQNNELFVSEKILKPLLMYQPFILIGPVGYLKHLREKYNFKTFSEFWDESYDSIIEPSDRIASIINLIRELNQKSIEELNELYQKTKDICIYNRQLLDSLQLDSFPIIFKKIVDEW